MLLSQMLPTGYMSAEEAAQKWGVSLRYVQRLAAQGRVEGAKKYGKAWMIPTERQKPEDPRRTAGTSKKPKYVPCGMITSILPLAPEAAEKALARLHPGYKAQREAELAYMRGDFAAAKRCFEKMDMEDPLYLCAAFTAAAAAISAGDYALYSEIELALKALAAKKELTDADRLTVQMMHAGVAVSMYAPSLAPDWLANGDIGILPPESHVFGLYLLTKYQQTSSSYKEMRATLRAILPLREDGWERCVTDVYFFLLLACAEMALKNQEEAERRLLEAMRLGLPQGIISPFAENLIAMGGMMQRCLKRCYPQYYDEVTALWQKINYNWGDFHNRFTHEHISLLLSMQEYQVATLAAHGATNQQIAQCMGCSVSYVKKLLSVVFEKLFINRRSDLKKYTL